jgi:hypothetical protein
MKKLLVFILFVVFVVIINFSTIINNTSRTNLTLKNLVSVTMAQAETSGTPVQCYISYDDPAWFVNDTYERRCSDCVTKKGHDWKNLAFCSL